MPRSPGPVLAVCGSGNAGHALAVAASRHFDGRVDWLVGSAERAELLRRGISGPGLRSIGALEARADRVQTISSDPAQVIPGADIVLIAVPAYAHAVTLDRIEPHLDEDAIVGCLPTRGGFEFAAARLGARRVVGLQTLPWSARVVAPGQEVLFNAIKEQVTLAALPAEDGPELAHLLSDMLGIEIVPADGFLNLTLGNTGQLIHPGLMYGHFGFWQGEDFERESVPLLYADATEEMGMIVEGLSREAVAVARAVEAESGGAMDLGGVAPIHEWLRASYANVTADTSTVAACFRTGPLQMRRAPMRETDAGRFVPDFDYRYLTEDVPYGLVVTRAVAELTGVATEAIDLVIHWAQRRMGRTYLAADGSLTGADTAGLPIPQNYGISTVRDLVAWYEDRPVTERLRTSLTESQ